MAKKRGPNKTTVRKNVKALRDASKNQSDPFEGLTDAQVLGLMHQRFDVMNRMGTGCLDGSVRGMIVSGAPGIGKTFNIEKLLKDQRINHPDFRYKVIKGAVTPINLFKVLQDYGKRGDVVLLDDVDSIFYDDMGIALLKAALDSGDERWITWLSESHALKDDGREYDREFEYKGTIIFITNTDFQALIDKGTSKLAPHFSALMSRSIYLDLKVHTVRSIAIWIYYLVNKENMLVNKYGLSKDQQKVALQYIMENRENMRTISLRDAMKIGQMMKTDPEYWQELADVSLLRDPVYRA
ncbi:MAG: ATP-binding protein [Betaproteobacteria bacterium]|jgi:hypothetical protein